MSDSDPDYDPDEQKSDATAAGRLSFLKDAYPAHLVTLTVDEKQKSEDDDAKYIPLRKKRIYLEIYVGEKEATAFEKEESAMKKLESIENGLLNRIDFAVSQRRFVTELHVAGALMNSAKA